LPDVSAELIYDQHPLGFGDAKPDLRSLALAYPQAAIHYPELRQKGFAVLRQAVRELPNDAEVQATYGLVLLYAQPGESARAAEALQRAIDLGSTSPEVRTRLADVRFQQGQVTAAIDLYKQSIQIDPLYTQAYLDLARAYLMLKDAQNAYQTLDRVLKVDLGNDTARQVWLQLKPRTAENH
jgi:tetratricopeptide (TPR) repeat protein